MYYFHFCHIYNFYVFATRQCRRRRYVFRLSGSSVEMLLPQYLVNGLNNVDKTDREYSLAPIDDLIRFWRSKVKVIAG